MKIIHRIIVKIAGSKYKDWLERSNKMVLKGWLTKLSLIAMVVAQGTKLIFPELTPVCDIIIGLLVPSAGYGIYRRVAEPK